MALHYYTASILLLLILPPAVLGQSPHLSPSPTPEPGLRVKTAIQRALKSAMIAEERIVKLASRSKRQTEKAALRDCLQLYSSTVLRLNKTLMSLTPMANPNDTQTWLSGALTNLMTCQESLKELGVYIREMPEISRNVAKQISSALGLNNGSNTISRPSSHEDGFPTWVTPRDRRLLQGQPPAWKPDAIVSLDGPGDYRTVESAIQAVKKSQRSKGQIVILVKAGTYTEQVLISEENVVVMGEGRGKTIFTGNLSMGGTKTSTYNSATFAVIRDGFIAQDVTFQNTAGPLNFQAVAFRSDSDRSVLYRCSFEGYQDTLYVHAFRQFYKNCSISGTVDFIFGNAAAVFQGCSIYGLESPWGVNTITAHARSEPDMNTGIIIMGCTVEAGVASASTTYLGRPWLAYARTVFVGTYLGSLVNPAGWLAWTGVPVPSTLYYAEYKNWGPGSCTSNRVTWVGYHVITNAQVASQFTALNFFGGWLQATGIPYEPDLCLVPC